MAKQRERIQIGTTLKITRKQHEDLLAYLRLRLDAAYDFQKGQIDRYTIIDREIAGYLIHEYEDKKRERDNKRGFGPKPTDAIINVITSQLDEAVTFLLTVLAPDEGIYNAVAPAEKQQIAKGFSKLMNKHADRFGHYAHYARGLLNALKYNFTGWVVEWNEITGNKVENDEMGLPEVKPNEVIFSGNTHEAIDPYNFLFDQSVEPFELPTKGEFFAIPQLITPFRMRKMAEDGEIFSSARFEKEYGKEVTYYTIKPELHPDKIGHHGQTNWFSVLSAMGGKEVTSGFELVHMYIWIRPKDFGLSAKTEYEIWRIGVMNAMHIAYAEPVKNAHGMLPVGIAVPLDDQFFPQTNSYADMLVPYQRFASFQLNVHQRTARKRLNGLTIYHKRFLSALSEDGVDLTGGLVPVDAPGEADFDISKYIKQFNEGPDTSNVVADIERMDALMQKILPTDMLRQVAGLDRATEYQAAATVQGSNRRNLKIAKLVDSQALILTRMMQYYNILERQQSMEILDEQGNLIEVNPKEFRETQLEFLIHAGLRGLDRLSLIMNIKEVLNSVLQSQTASQRIDVVAVIDYFTSLIGDHSDFKQFEYKTQFDQLTPDQKNMAFQLLQQAVQQQQGGGGQQVQQAAV